MRRLLAALLLTAALAGCQAETRDYLADVPPSAFSIRVEPGLSLADTSFTVAGTPTLVQLGQGGATWAEVVASRALNVAVQKVTGHRDAVACLWPRDVCGPISARIEAVAAEHGTTQVTFAPEALTYHLIDNTGNSSAADLSATVSDSVSIGAASTWTESTSTGHSYSASVEVGYGAAKSSAGVEYSFTTTRGHDTSETRTVDVGNSDTVTVPVPAYSAKIAVLLIQRGTLRGTVTFASRWTGGPIGWCRVAVGQYNCESRPANTLTLAELAPHLPSAENIAGAAATLNIAVTFAADDDVKVLDLAVKSADSISAAVAQALCDYSGRVECPRK